MTPDPEGPVALVTRYHEENKHRFDDLDARTERLEKGVFGYITDDGKEVPGILQWMNRSDANTRAAVGVAKWIGGSAIVVLIIQTLLQRGWL